MRKLMLSTLALAAVLLVAVSKARSDDREATEILQRAIGAVGGEPSVRESKDSIRRIEKSGASQRRDADLGQK